MKEKQYYEAELLFIQSVQIKSKFTRGPHVDVAEAFYRAGLATMQEGDLKKAQAYIQRVSE